MATPEYGRPRVLARRRHSGHIEREVALVIAGIDTQKDSLAVAVVDEAGRLVAGGDVPNTEQGFAQLVDIGSGGSASGMWAVLRDASAGRAVRWAGPG